MKKIILLLTIIFMVHAVSNAQLGNFIKNRVSKGLNAVAKEKANEADTAAKKNIENSPAADQKEKEQANQEGIDIGKFFGGKVDLKYNEEYNFTSKLYMVTETYDKKEVMKVDILMYFSANSPSLGMETKSITDEKGNHAPVSSQMVMDGENKCFIILTDMNGSKIGLISPIPDENSTPAQSNGKTVRKVTPSNFAKTGNSKVIAGYKCDEYSYSDTENKTTGKLWFTKDANLKIDKRGWQKTGMGTYYGYSGFEGGVILASEAYNEKGTLVMKSETKEINPNFSHSIPVKGYRLTQMNFNQGQPKK